jgi:hypothetical protein
VSTPSEEQFESSICDWLASSGGYAAVKNDRAQGAASDFDAARGLDTTELWQFVDATQPEQCAELTKRYGGNAATARSRFADRLSSELDKRGTVDVLRHGVVDQGVTLRLASKATLRTGVGTGEVIKALETAAVKTVAAFANSQEGGTPAAGRRRRRDRPRPGPRLRVPALPRQGRP